MNRFKLILATALGGFVMTYIPSIISKNPLLVPIVFMGCTSYFIGLNFYKEDEDDPKRTILSYTLGIFLGYSCLLVSNTILLSSLWTGIISGIIIFIGSSNKIFLEKSSPLIFIGGASCLILNGNILETFFYLLFGTLIGILVNFLSNFKFKNKI